MAEEKGHEEEVVEEQEVEAVVEEAAVEEEKKPERPEINYQKELERKNRELDKLRAEREAYERNAPAKRDANDLSTWNDHELKAVIKSGDASVAAFKDQAEDILLDRRVRAIREKERLQEKRALSDLELRSKYPDAEDPMSELSIKMAQIMNEYDLQKSPAGKLAAAKLASVELGKGRSEVTAKERKAEADRVARVKGQMVDGDRSKPASGSNSPKKTEELENRVRSGDEKAFGELLAQRGLTRDKFFPKK